MRSLDDVVSYARSKGVDVVKFAFIGLDGVLRAKASYIDYLRENMETGIGLTMAMQSFTALDTLAPQPRFGPEADDVFLYPDPSTFSHIPHAPGVGRVICDLRLRDGGEWSFCTRTLLRRLTERWRDEKGMEFQVAAETEFYILRQDEQGGVKPTDWERCFSTVGYDNLATAAHKVIEGLKAANVKVVRLIKEYGPGQLEINMAHTDPVRSADNMLILRDTARGAASSMGLTATFMPKPFDWHAGNGMHLHISARNPETGRNLFYDDGDVRGLGLSDLAYSFIAGILRHIKALTAIVSPTINSYKRLIPGSWAPSATCYGYNNRSAALRVPASRTKGEEKAKRVEFRVPDPSSNPYLAIAATLAAGMDGISRGLDPGDPVNKDAYSLSAEEMRERGIEFLPRSLREALTHLERDGYLKEALGEDLVEEFIKIKRVECDAYDRHVSPWEVKNYIQVF